VRSCLISVTDSLNSCCIVIMIQVISWSINNRLQQCFDFEFVGKGLRVLESLCGFKLVAGECDGNRERMGDYRCFWTSLYGSFPLEETGIAFSCRHLSTTGCYLTALPDRALSSRISNQRKPCKDASSIRMGENWISTHQETLVSACAGMGA